MKTTKNEQLTHFWKPLVLSLFLAVWGISGIDAAGSNDAVQPEDSLAESIVISDALGRDLRISPIPENVICSGPGCLRLLTYLQKQDMVVAVDDMEGKRPKFDARPYAMANPQYAELPVFGEFRGHDNPELIVALEPFPDVILKTYPGMGTDPIELEQKTGIPVATFNYGNLTDDRETFYESLRTMGRIVDASERAEEVIAFIDSTIEDLHSRTADIPETDRISCFVGGIANRGPHGLRSTEPTYPPFVFVNANNVAFNPNGSDGDLDHSDVAKEIIVEWDPEVIFVDVSTIQSDPQANALYELQNDPAFANLKAVESGNIYGLMPYNWYTQNIGSILADAYFVGSVLYPDRFADVDPEAKADEIYEFLVGGKVYHQLKDSFSGLVFERILF
jgi:iron complex transport system substrate-binding protein